VRAEIEGKVPMPRGGEARVRGGRRARGGGGGRRRHAGARAFLPQVLARVNNAALGAQVQGGQKAVGGGEKGPAEREHRRGAPCFFKLCQMQPGL
jgi:hypothetical protein